MASSVETGHAKTVANLQQLISFITAHGAVYVPSYAAIKLPALNALLLEAQAAMDAMNTAKPAHDHATAAREIEFKKLNAFTTRVINTLSASGVSAKTVAQARTIVRKLSGKRADNSTTTTATTTTGIDPLAKRQISVSQMSFDNRIENFSKLVNFLATVPEYIPNEPELSIAGLNNYLSALENKNTDVFNAAVPLSNARMHRNKILYKESVGVVAVANDAKKYIKAVFGASSSEYKQLGKLSFRISK